MPDSFDTTSAPLSPAFVREGSLAFEVTPWRKHDFNFTVGIVGLAAAGQITHKALHPGRTGIECGLVVPMFALFLETVGPVDKVIVPTTAIQGILTKTANQQIIPIISLELIVPGAAEQTVVAGAADQDVIAAAGKNPVVAAATKNRVVTAASKYFVVAGTTIDQVGTAVAENPIMAVTAVKLIVGAGADQLVVACPTDEDRRTPAGIQVIVTGASIYKDRQVDVARDVGVVVAVA